MMIDAKSKKSLKFLASAYTCYQQSMKTGDSKDLYEFII